MAATIPASLKTADIQRFAVKAAQLSKIRPIVAYWCNYLIVQKILAQSLHTTSDEAFTYTTTLMDDLETAKAASQDPSDAILDDVAAKAYIEAFSLETFSRADNAQRSNQVTRQTADTFQAAIVFMDLMQIWGSLEQELESKKRFAKFHAVRIAKAIKAGEDPNATNPVVEQPPQPSVEEGDEFDRELKDLERDARDLGSGGGGGLGGDLQPTVESAPESKQPSRPGSSLQAPPPDSPVVSPNGIPNEISPMDPADAAVISRQGSTGGGYFPSVPASTSTYNTATSQQQSPETETGMPAAGLPSPPAQQQQQQQQPTPFTPSDFYNAPPGQQPPPPTIPIARPQRPPPEQAIVQPAPHPISNHSTPVPPQAQPQAYGMGQGSGGFGTGPPPGGYNTDDESTMAAQKHAKWAISALNFEDVGTAVKELRAALQSLGVQ